MPAMPMTNQIFARQVGRLAFGVVLLAGVSWLVATLGMASFDLLGPDKLPMQHAASKIIAVTWLAALAVGAAVRVIAARRSSPRSLDARFAVSLMVPAAGIALLLPITLHLPVVALLADLDFFDVWAMGSLWITGLAHLVFAGLGVLRAYQLAAGKRAISPPTVYVATLFTSCVPVVFLADARVLFVKDMVRCVSHSELGMIPPVVVAVTALPFLALLHAMQRLTDRERAEIAAAQVLPRAVAVRSTREV